METPSRPETPPQDRRASHVGGYASSSTPPASLPKVPPGPAPGAQAASTPPATRSPRRDWHSVSVFAHGPTVDTGPKQLLVAEDIVRDLLDRCGQHAVIRALRLLGRSDLGPCTTDLCLGYAAHPGPCDIPRPGEQSIVAPAELPKVDGLPGPGSPESPPDRSWLTLEPGDAPTWSLLFRRGEGKEMASHFDDTMDRVERTLARIEARHPIDEHSRIRDNVAALIALLGAREIERWTAAALRDVQRSVRGRQGHATPRKDT